MIEIEGIELPLRVKHQLLILLLGSADRPISSEFHVHKELFILTRTFPKLSELFEFDAYRKGPFSRVAQDTLDDLIERGYVISVGGSYALSEQGRAMYEDIVNGLRRKDLINTMKRIRDMYDKLSIDELLLLVYVTYPEYTVESEELRRILRKAPMIVDGLLRKGVITERRKEEILNKLKQLLNITEKR